MPLWLKIATIAPAVVDGIKFIVRTVAARKQRKLTEAEREAALKEAVEHAKDIADAAVKAKAK